jgi:signal transduction histidine kinase
MQEYNDAAGAALTERASPGTIERQTRLILDTGLLETFYDAMTELVLILNRQRQVVFCNKQWAQLVGVKDRRVLYGRRIGEAMGCANSHSSGGCGSGEGCAFCGALQATLTVQQQSQPGLRETQFLRGHPPEAMDILVRTTPLTLDGEPFTIVAMSDISHLKRRRALERIFFHDLLNTVASMRLISDLLVHTKPDKLKDMAGRVGHGVRRLMEEIASQRDLMAAEGNELAIHPLEVRSLELLKQVVEDYQDFAAPRRCRLVVDAASEDVLFSIDITILSRVVGNMLKNAIEASDDGEVITAGCKGGDSNVTFWVHNRAFIPREVQLQLFKRSFSTKGLGRGLGTYSMLLLTEKYLKGHVSFTSTQDRGTTFTVALPRMSRS